MRKLVSAGLIRRSRRIRGLGQVPMSKCLVVARVEVTICLSREIRRGVGGRLSAQLGAAKPAREGFENDFTPMFPWPYWFQSSPMRVPGCHFVCCSVLARVVRFQMQSVSRWRAIHNESCTIDHASMEPQGGEYNPSISHRRYDSN